MREREPRQKVRFYDYYEDQDNGIIPDNDFHKGQDASSNWEQRRKIIFARHFSSIGNVCLGDDFSWYFLDFLGRVFEKGYHSLTIEEERKIVQVNLTSI